MRRKRNLLGIIVMFMFTFMMTAQLQAATLNPLANIPQNDVIRTIVSSSGGIGCDYFTPEFTKNFTLRAVSSNTKVAVPKIYSFQNVRDGKKIYSKGIMIRQKGYGTAKITITAKVGAKTYKRNVVFKSYKYECPLTSIKINGKEYISKFRNPKWVSTASDPYSSHAKSMYVKLGATPYGKISFKTKSGYKVNSIMVRKNVITDYSKPSTKIIKNGQKIPKGYSLARISYQNTKTKAYGGINVNK